MNGAPRFQWASTTGALTCTVFTSMTIETSMRPNSAYQSCWRRRTRTPIRLSSERSAENSKFPFEMENMVVDINIYFLQTLFGSILIDSLCWDLSGQIVVSPIFYLP
jgi:hypothetical protein